MLPADMATWKRLLKRARSYAEQAVPDDVLAAGRRLRDRVVEAAPAPIAAAIERLTAVVEQADPAAPPESITTPHPIEVATEVAAGPDDDNLPLREDPEDILRRVKARAEHGLKPEDTLVVIYATAGETEATDEIVRCFDGIDTTVRVMDLDREPQTKRQLARLTDVMVPPYVFINGRYWGAQYEIVALALTGDLPAVVAHRLDEIGPEARRIGKVHDSYSDAMTAENIVTRWRLGHILCVDDLDAWFEQDKAGAERFFYQGGERPAGEMTAVAADVAKRIEAGEIEAQWRLDTIVHVH